MTERIPIGKPALAKRNPGLGSPELATITGHLPKGGYRVTFASGVEKDLPSSRVKPPKQQRPRRPVVRTKTVTAGKVVKKPALIFDCIRCNAAPGTFTLPWADRPTHCRKCVVEAIEEHQAGSPPPPVVVAVVGESRAVSKPLPPIRCEAFKAWIRPMPCIHCGAPAISDPDHVGPRGVGQKTDDPRCVPLCRRCHTERTDTDCLPGLTKQETELLILRVQVELILRFARPFFEMED